SLNDMTCRSSALLMSVAVLACAGGCGPAASHSETDSTNGYPAAPQERASNSCPAPSASGKADGVQPNKVVFIGGVCSTQFDSPDSPLGEWPDKKSVDAAIDQRFEMSTPVTQLRLTLDKECTGDSWCSIHAYSNGAAVLSKTLSLFDATQWNILWVDTVASNEGGSELSASRTASVLEAVGLTDCELMTSISPSDHRSGWNHNDTGNHIFYMQAGHEQWWSTGAWPHDFFSGMANDGLVAFHSAGGMNDTFHVPEDDPWLCFREPRHFVNHRPTGACDGAPRDHDAMKIHGLPGAK
ncbi:MAG TPA: hypothetical protein PKD61_36360, partial [Polyangiaceae bacterium]|nr:hypothetical protein [Polyangiaceae bacterium]